MELGSKAVHKQFGLKRLAGRGGMGEHHSGVLRPYTIKRERPTLPFRIGWAKKPDTQNLPGVVDTLGGLGEGGSVNAHVRTN